MAHAFAAISHFRRTNRIEEAVQIALGKLEAPRIKEDAGKQVSQSQIWFLNDQDKLNRFQQYLQNQLGLTCTVADYSNGSQGGYAVTVTGNYSEQDIANAAGSLSATRLDNLPGTIA